jgi:hypothetical protein
MKILKFRNDFKTQDFIETFFSQVYIRRFYLKNFALAIEFFEFNLINLH